MRMDDFGRAYVTPGAWRLPLELIAVPLGGYPLWDESLPEGRFSLPSAFSRRIVHDDSFRNSYWASNMWAKLVPRKDLTNSS